MTGRRDVGPRRSWHLWLPMLALLPCTSSVFARGRDALATFPAPPHTYELSYERCMPDDKASDQPGCPFAIRLFRDAAELDRIELSITSCGEPEPVDVTRRLGADRDARAWTTRDEHCEVQTAARTVELAPNVVALLVTQRGGYEYVHRNQELYLAEKQKLKRLWSYQEGIGAESWTTTTVLATSEPHRQDVALIDVTRASGNGAARITARRLRFDRSARRVVSSPLPDRRNSLYLVRVGSFQSAGAALTTRPSCVYQYDVIRARVFPRLRLPGFFRGIVYARQEDARAALDELARCPDRWDASIVELTP